MNEKDRLKKLRKKLYSRTRSTLKKGGRHSLRPEEYEVRRAWEEQPAKEKGVMPRVKKGSPLKLFFIFSLIFFLGSVIFGAFYFFGGKNIISSENVDIEIQGPTSIGGGDELSLQISILNKNTIALEAADLLIEYPEGTRSADNLDRELPRYRESLGDIAPGARVKRTARSVLFGEENTEQKIKVTIEYRVADSNAIFYSEKEYAVTLTSAPVGISVRSLGEVTSGQGFDFSLVITSNVTTEVNNLTVQAEYPFGFSFEGANPQPAFSNSIWELGDLRPGEEKVVHISGTLTGQENEERVFRFAVGIRDELDVKKLATTFVTATRLATIKRPFISTQLSFNGLEDTAYVFDGSERINGEIAWKNNLPDAVSNAQVEVRFSGNALEEQSVFAERGFYNSVTDTIRWGRDTLDDLASINPDQAGILRFGFSSKNISAYAIENPEIILDITVRGAVVGEGGAPEEVTSNITRSIKLTSDLMLSARLLRTTGPFVNAGPLPPKAEAETMYTVAWTVTNTASRVSGAKITAQLPSYVRWIGNVSPQGTDIHFNQSTRQITWNIGEVPEKTGTEVSPKEVAFQIGFTPSLSQVGETPVLITSQAISGFDQFTEKQIEESVSPLEARVSSEAGLPSGHDRVVK